MPCSDHLPGSEGRNSVGRNEPQQKPQPGRPQDAGPRLSNDLELIWWIIVTLPMFSSALAVVSHPAGALRDPARTWSRIAPGDTAEPQHRAPIPWGQWCAQGCEAPSLMRLYSCKMMLVCRQHLVQMGCFMGDKQGGSFRMHAAHAAMHAFAASLCLQRHTYDQWHLKTHTRIARRFRTIINNH